VLGDCQALVCSTLTTRHKAIDTLMEDVRTLLVEHALLQGSTVDYLLANPQLIQAKLDDLMQLQPAFQNSSVPSHFRYVVLDGFFSDCQQVQVVKLPAIPTEVVLATDGYPQLYPTLSASEEALSLQLRRDPLMVSTCKATKPIIAGNLSFDDRSFLRITV
jgi:glycerophosphoryl diester phosphodiesterase